MIYNLIDGGICAAKGFMAAGIHAGIRKNKTKRDLSLIYSEKRASAAAVYTQNLVKGAPIEVTRKNLEDGFAQAIIVNSGNANTCNADGPYIAETMCKLTGEALGIDKKDVVVASTGVIGQPLPIEPFETGIPAVKNVLSYDGSKDAAEGIMTTDTKLKEISISFDVDGKEVRIGGIAKGSGMIHPNMATMLVFVTTDCNITSEMLNLALKEDVKDSFNMISVDGDTSTNDMVTVLANGMAENSLIDKIDENYSKFCDALSVVTKDLCRKIAQDGEGATKLLECNVVGAENVDSAKTIAKSVVCSSLLKAAMFGKDANWGRILCAIGYSGAYCDVTKVKVDLCSENGCICVCENGSGIDFDEEKASYVLEDDEIKINVTLQDGAGFATAWGCDLTYDYVKINGDYRT